jgi:hypothetical protein
MGRLRVHPRALPMGRLRVQPARCLWDVPVSSTALCWLVYLRGGLKQGTLAGTALVTDGSDEHEFGDADDRQGPSQPEVALILGGSGSLGSDAEACDM